MNQHHRRAVASLPVGDTVAVEGYAPQVGLGVLSVDPVRLAPRGDGGLGDHLRTRNRRMVTLRDLVALAGSRSIRGRPGGEKWTPSPSSTGKT